jgi:hypothetical protein
MATNMFLATFRAVRTRIKNIITIHSCGVILAYFKYICMLPVLATLMVATSGCNMIVATMQ